MSATFAPRFGVDTRVLAKVSGDRTRCPGVIVQAPYRQAGKIMPYQILLDDGRLVYAPRDDDACVMLSKVSVAPVVASSRVKTATDAVEDKRDMIINLLSAEHKQLFEAEQREIEASAATPVQKSKYYMFVISSLIDANNSHHTLAQSMQVSSVKWRPGDNRWCPENSPMLNAAAETLQPMSLTRFAREREAAQRAAGSPCDKMQYLLRVIRCLEKVDAGDAPSYEKALRYHLFLCRNGMYLGEQPLLHVWNPYTVISPQDTKMLTGEEAQLLEPAHAAKIAKLLSDLTAEHQQKLAVERARTFRAAATPAQRGNYLAVLLTAMHMAQNQECDSVEDAMQILRQETSGVFQWWQP